MSTLPSAGISGKTAWLDRADPEFNRAWDTLYRLTGSYADLNRQSGEVWQYMGSVRYFGKWQHEFRHRDRPRPSSGQLPDTGRVYLKIAATPDWKPTEGGAA